MPTRISHKEVNSDFKERLEYISGENVYKCYQCGKCSAGCPMTDKMDILPNQVLRYLQMGDTSVFSCHTIWLCAACLTCDVRCPKGIDISRIMEGVRQLTLRKNVDKVKPESISQEDYNRLPQIALVAAFRKFTG
ncbi:MAG: 4Fe-4S dicluster domain-containing protein [Planctomycetota bacterium]